jgi:uncharacterized protein (TIGR03437 family)
VQTALTDSTLEQLPIQHLHEAIWKNRVSFPAQVPASPTGGRHGPPAKMAQLYFVMGWSLGEGPARVDRFADLAGAFGPATGVPLTNDAMVGNKLPTSLGGVQVFFNGIAAPMIYASATQINTIVPYEIAGSSDVDVAVAYNGQTSAPFGVKTVAAQPALFTATATGAGQGAAGQYDLLGNYRGLNSADNPVTRGGIITLFATGEGKTSGGVTGAITTAQASAPYTPQPQFAPSVLIDGQPATVVFYGEVPGVVAGMMQINAIVPTTAHAGTVTVSISMGTFYSQAGVTIAAQ